MSSKLQETCNSLPSFWDIIIYPRDSTKNLGDIEPATLKIMTNTIFSRHHLHHIGTTSHLIPPTLTTTGISPAATTGSDDKDLPGHEEGREVSFIHQGDHHDCDNEYDDNVLSLWQWIWWQSFISGDDTNDDEENEENLCLSISHWPVVMSAPSCAAW